MAATGKTPILLYGSTTPTNAPVAGNLTNSSDGCEIAINVADKNLFFKDSTNAVNTVPIRQSSASSNGWLSSTDWSTFNGKVSSQWTTSSSNIYYSTGNVGVGTTTPPSAISVVNGTLSVSGSSAGLGVVKLGDPTDATPYVGMFRGAVASTTTAGNYLNLGGYDGIAFNASPANLNAQTNRGLFSASTGDFTLVTGNLVIGTSGKGIDFSATAGTGTSELLADYEEGTWTPTQGAGLTVVGSFSSGGWYTKVGRLVTVNGYVAGSTSVASAAGGIFCGGLPYTAAQYNVGSARNAGFSVFGGVATAFTDANLYAVTSIAATTSIAFTITYWV